MKKILISYFGKYPQEAGLAAYLSKMERATEGTIYFRPSSTVEVSSDELAILQKDFPWIMRFVNVHMPSEEKVAEVVGNKDAEVTKASDRVEEVVEPVSLKPSKAKSKKRFGPKK